MISYKLTPNDSDIEDAVSLFKFVGGNTTRSIYYAINKTGPIIRTASSAAIRAQVRLPASYLNQRGNDGRQRMYFRRATYRNLSGAIATPSRGILSSRYSTDPQLQLSRTSWLKPPDEPARGIRLKIKPSGPTKGLSSDYFYMVLPSSRALAIVKRIPTLGSGRDKIDVMHSPSLSQVFNDVKQDVTPQAQRVYTDKLLEAMNYVLRRQYPPED